MAKELPYFQFEPAEYLTKDISFCSLSAQGLFINICSYYWQRNCKLTESQLLRRLDYKEELKELLDEEIIFSNDGNITISFLDDQKVNATKTSTKNSNNGKKGGRPKTQTKAKLNPNKSQTKGIREDKIKEYEKIENKKIKDNILNNFSWLESIAMKKRIDLDKVKLYLGTFLDDLELKDDLDKPEKEIKIHFVNWLNGETKKEAPKVTKANYKI